MAQSSKVVYLFRGQRISLVKIVAFKRAWPVRPPLPYDVGTIFLLTSPCTLSYLLIPRKEPRSFLRGRSTCCIKLMWDFKSQTLTWFGYFPFFRIKVSLLRIARMSIDFPSFHSYSTKHDQSLTKQCYQHAEEGPLGQRKWSCRWTWHQSWGPSVPMKVTSLAHFSSQPNNVRACHDIL